MREEIICAREGCGVVFVPKTHNQKYHSNECCRAVTNARIMQRYYEQKAIRSGRPRVCKTRGCDQQLSRYNYGKYCAACELRKDLNVRNNLRAAMEAIAV